MILIRSEKIDKAKLHPLEFIEKDKPVKDIYEIVKKNTADAYVVIDKDTIVGIVTNTDVAMKATKEEIFDKGILVSQIMSSPAITMDINHTLGEVIDFMAAKNIQKLLITEKNFPVGIIYGEDVLKFDSQKWMSILFNQTIKEVYMFLKRDPEMGFDLIYNAVTDMDRFENLDSDLEFQLYVYQEGLVLVAYNFIKENPCALLDDVKKNIKSDYAKLLNKYSK